MDFVWISVCVVSPTGKKTFYLFVHLINSLWIVRFLFALVRNWMDRNGSCRFLMWVYLWIFIQCHGRITCQAVFSLHLFIICVCLPGFIDSPLSSGSWVNEWVSVCVCSAKHALVFHSGAATYVPYSHCMLPNNWHDYILFNCSKANVDSNGSLLALLIYQFEKKSYFIYSTRIPLIKKPHI